MAASLTRHVTQGSRLFTLRHLRMAVLTIHTQRPLPSVAATAQSVNVAYGSSTSTDYVKFGGGDMAQAHNQV